MKNNQLQLITVTAEVDRYGNPNASELDLIDVQDFTFNNYDEAINFALSVTSALTKASTLLQQKTNSVNYNKKHTIKQKFN